MVVEVVASVVEEVAEAALMVVSVDVEEVVSVAILVGVVEVDLVVAEEIRTWNNEVMIGHAIRVEITTLHFDRHATSVVLQEEAALVVEEQCVVDVVDSVVIGINHTDFVNILLINVLTLETTHIVVVCICN